MRYKNHPLSDLLPLMSEAELAELTADIKVNGLLAPITLLDGKILDGRNRYLACKKARVEPRFRDFPEKDDPLAFVISANIKRRHLNESQRALIAGKIANMQVGNPKLLKLPDFPNSANLPNCISQGEAAEKMNVSERSVRTAKKVLKKPHQKI